MTLWGYFSCVREVTGGASRDRDLNERDFFAHILYEDRCHSHFILYLIPTSLFVFFRLHCMYSRLRIITISK